MTETPKVYYALNTKKGTTINHPSIGKIPGLMAAPIRPDQVNIAKHLMNVIVFEGLLDMTHEQAIKKSVGETIEEFKNEDKHIMTYNEFVSKMQREKGYGIVDIKEKGLWRAYQEDMGIVHRK